MVAYFHQQKNGMCRNHPDGKRDFDHEKWGGRAGVILYQVFEMLQAFPDSFMKK